MSEIPYERIEEANEGLQRFHFRIENTLGTIFEGELDFAKGQQYVQIGLASESFPIAEIFWVGEKGYGRQLHPNIWFSLRGKPFPNYLQSALRTLMDGSVISTGEEENFWIVDIQPKDFPPRDNPEHFYRSIFGELVDPQHKEFLERVIELSRSAEVKMRMRISRGDLLIQGLTVKGQAREIRSELTAAFSPSETVIPPFLTRHGNSLMKDSRFPSQCCFSDFRQLVAGPASGATLHGHNDQSTSLRKRKRRRALKNACIRRYTTRNGAPIDSRKETL